jgi:hypothetical protein
MKWVTRKRIKLDRSACAWLILRHIDPQAQITYVEAEDLPKAIEEGALPFHNTVSEEPGMRERTSFQELLAEYRLDESNPALALLGEMVYGAETKDLGSIEEAEGLRAIAKGMNSLCQSDKEMVERMMPVFDALYAYCVRRVAGIRGWANEDNSQARSTSRG